MNLADTASSGAGSVVVTIVLSILGIGIYWLPTIISAIRHLPHTGSIAVTNFFAFALMIPWVIALVMAVRSQPRPQYVVPSGWGPQPPLPPAPYGMRYPDTGEQITWDNLPADPRAPLTGPAARPPEGLQKPYGYQ